MSKVRRKKINVRKHLRTLSSGNRVFVRRHKRNIRVKDHRNRSRNSNRQINSNSMQFKVPKWQLSALPDSRDFDRVINGTGDKKYRLTVTPFTLNRYFSYYVFPRDKDFRDLVSGNTIIGFAGASGSVRPIKDSIDFQSPTTNKNPRGFDRKPAKEVKGAGIEYGYNPVMYTAEKKSINLVPIFDEDDVIESRFDQHKKERLNKKLSQYIYWLERNRGKLKKDYNNRLFRNWKGDFYAPKFIFVSNYTENDVARNVGQIPLTGFVPIKKTAKKIKFNGVDIPYYEISEVDKDSIMPITGKHSLKAFGDVFTYRYPTIFTKMNNASQSWMREGRSEQLAVEKREKERKYKRDYNDWVNKYERFHKSLPKDLRNEIVNIKQLSIPIKFWEPSDYALYRTLIRLRTGTDRVSEAGLPPPPDPEEYGLLRHKRKKR